jgi:TATA-box binding protein (TBP) (component of TFIID and TFIIIB)
LLAHENHPNVNNYVVNVRLNLPLSLKPIVLAAPNAEFVPARIKAVKLRLNSGTSSNATCLVFDSGYMIISGAPSLYEAIHETHRYLAFLMRVEQPVFVQGGAPAGGAPLDPTHPECIVNWQSGLPGAAPGTDMRITCEPLGSRLTCTRIDVVNIVCNGVVSDRPLDLKRMARQYPEITDYNSEIFPGLRIKVRPEDVPGLHRACKAGIFDSGKAIIMGPQRESDIVLVHRYLVRFVRDFVDYDRPAVIDDIYAFRAERDHEADELESLLYDVSRPRIAPLAVPRADDDYASGSDSATQEESRPRRGRKRRRKHAVADPPAFDPAGDIGIDQLELLAAYF